MTYTYIGTNGRRSINSSATFVGTLANRSVLSLASFDEFFSEAERLVRVEHPSVDANALSNVRGDWYEWLISIGTIEFLIANPTANYLLPLPNVSQYDCSRLYVEKLHSHVNDLRDKVLTSTGARLITSNPDFVLISRTKAVELPNFSPSITEETITEIDGLYQQVSGLCSFEEIKGYASVKVSLRPDRRLQIPHEGSLVKALYRHIQTREWLIDASGIKYYAITTSFNAADERGLKTVATHSITDVSAKPEAAVDQLLRISSGHELDTALRSILF